MLVIYLLIFVFQNANKELIIWWWFGKNLNTSALELIPAMLLAGVLGTLVVRMAFRAVKQIRDLRRRMADLAGCTKIWRRSRRKRRCCKRSRRGPEIRGTRCKGSRVLRTAVTSRL